MATSIQIRTTNYTGQTANVVFTPSNGNPPVNLGNVLLPYTYTAINDFVYGEYTLTFFTPKTYVCTLTATPSTFTSSSSNAPTINSVTVAGVLGTNSSVDGIKGSSSILRQSCSLVADSESEDLFFVENSFALQTLRRVTQNGSIYTIVSNHPAMSRPSSITRTEDGEYYIANNTSTILKVNVNTGNVTLFAGNSAVPGFQDGSVENSLFFSPLCITSKNKMLYICDFGNSSIRTIDTVNKNVALFAGIPGMQGNINKTSLTSTFSKLVAIAVDSLSNVYVKDWGCIKKITNTGNVFILAGKQDELGYNDGFGSSARFGYEGSLAVDEYGNVYYADYDNNCIRIISEIGEVKTLCGAGPTNPGFSDIPNNILLNKPLGICYKQNAIYITDTNNFLIRKITLL